MKKLLLPILLIVLAGCGDDISTDSNANANDSIETPKKVEVAFEKAKQIFYSLPSPVETAMIINNTNVLYTNDMLLSSEYVDFYETSDKQALALGVYSADLSYITMFDQQQDEIEYLADRKKLADKLGLLNVISDSIITELQESVTDKDRAMNIISEQFMEVNAFLEENNRTTSATLMVYGGWIEGLYLSVMLAGENVDDNPELVQVISEQSFSLSDLIALLELYKDDEIVGKYLPDLKELFAIYQNLKTPMSQENFDQIKSKVKMIRSTITSYQ